MIYKRYALFCFLLLVGTILPIVNESEFSLMSSIIAQNIDTKESEADNLLEKGIQQYQTSQFREALQSWEKALEIYQEIKNRPGEAQSLGNLGIAYQDIGNHQKSLDNLKEALKIAQEIDNSSMQSFNLDIGVAYASLGQYQQAISYFKQSLNFAERTKNLQIKAKSLGNIGNCYYILGKYKEAIPYHLKALEIAQMINDTHWEAQSLGNLANDYDSLGNHQEAIGYYEKTLNVFRALNDFSNEAKSLDNIGIAYYSIGQYKKAIEYQQKSLTISRKIGDRTEEANVLNNLGVVYRDSNQIPEAIKMLEASLNIYLDMRGGLSRENRREFLDSQQKTVNSLANLLIQQKQPEKAFQWLNLATTADLADYNRLIDGKVANPEAQKAIDNWKTNNQQLEAMRQQLQTKFSNESARQMREVEAKVNQEAETIAKKYPEVAELFETKPTDIAQLQQNIAPDTLVIQPVPLRDKIAIFLLTKDKLTVIESNTKADEFNQLVNQYRNQLADYQNADYIDTSSKLYDILIRPIEQQIKTNSPKNLAIIATDQLRYIPFESLYDSKTEQYLLQKYPISYLTRISTANISNSPSKTAKNLNALALANPKPTNQELKGTEKEAENLLKIFPQSETYLGEKATLDTFKTQASRFSILHLGTHGCFNPDGCPDLKMQANTILFANNQQYNIADAALLGLKNTELITLAACQTAKEANANGQEISGLAYVLERAGAKSAIASLWNAQDNTSAEIMTQFYQNLQKGMTKSEAMQKAKLSQIDQHPFFWSPFILIGDAQ